MIYEFSLAIKSRATFSTNKNVYFLALETFGRCDWFIVLSTPFVVSRFRLVVIKTKVRTMTNHSKHTKNDKPIRMRSTEVQAADV